MTSIPGISNTASLILQQLKATAPKEEGESNQVNLTVLANRMKTGGTVSGPETQAEAKTADQLSAAGLIQYKVMLYKRVGNELGVKEEDYATPQQYASALRDAVSKIRAQKDGEATIKAIEHDLGLDKLGASLDTVINSIDDPEAGKTLDAALKRAVNTGGITLGSPDASAMGAVQINEIGMYRPAKT